MPKLRVHNFSTSLDGYAAGLNQGPDKPFGDVDVPGPGFTTGCSQLEWAAG
jgi:hypothetical protein